jgi:hypothetical protein
VKYVVEFKPATVGKETLNKSSLESFCTIKFATVPFPPSMTAKLEQEYVELIVRFVNMADGPPRYPAYPGSDGEESMKTNVHVFPSSLRKKSAGLVDHNIPGAGMLLVESETRLSAIFP